MTWMTMILLAQAQAAQLPTTGSAALDNLASLIWALLGAMGLREGTYWLGKLKERRANGGGNGNGDIDRTLERIAASMERQTAINERQTLINEETRREQREAHGRIEGELVELRRRVGA
jgi:hypothetical protein